MRIGIPRSLLYYYFHPFWAAFFAEVGLEAVTSPPTNQAIMRDALRATIDEICLPVKLHLGHLLHLSGRADLLFSPGFGRWGARGWFCPKLMGLPDLVRNKLANTVEFWHDLDAEDRIKPGPWYNTLRSIMPGVDRRRINAAWERAEAARADGTRLLAQGYPPPAIIDHLTAGSPLPRRTAMPLNLAVLGHPYLVYDEFPNQQLLAGLRKAGSAIWHQENVPPAEHDREWPGQEKRIYWPLGRHILAAALYYTQKQPVDGIILISACLCGPDALLGELLTKYMGDVPAAPPLLRLTIDEHTGRAGLLTRIEAFLDLIAWRKNHAAV